MIDNILLTMVDKNSDLLKKQVAVFMIHILLYSYSADRVGSSELGRGEMRGELATLWFDEITSIIPGSESAEQSICFCVSVL